MKIDASPASADTEKQVHNAHESFQSHQSHNSNQETVVYAYAV